MIHLTIEERMKHAGYMLLHELQQWEIATVEYDRTEKTRLLDGARTWAAIYTALAHMHDNGKTLEDFNEHD